MCATHWQSMKNSQQTTLINSRSLLFEGQKWASKQSLTASEDWSMNSLEGYGWQGRCTHTQHAMVQVRSVLNFDEISDLVIAGIPN
jgi:hypothetical protein